jgi:hypothetical protein
MECKQFDERGRVGAFGQCREGRGEKGDRMPFVVRALRRSIKASGRLTKSDLGSVYTTAVPRHLPSNIQAPGGRVGEGGCLVK